MIEPIEQPERICFPCGLKYDTKKYGNQCPKCQNQEQNAKAQAGRSIIYGLTGNLNAMTFSTFKSTEQPAAFAEAMKFIDDLPHGRVLVLLGAPGTGKTHLIVAICLAALNCQINGAYRSMVTLTNEWKRAEDWGQYHREKITPLFDIELLALDELGREARTDQMLAGLDELIDYRYIHGLATVLGSNLKSSAFEQYVGDSLWSRLSHSGWAEIITMAGKWPDNDYRRRLRE